MNARPHSIVRLFAVFVGVLIFSASNLSFIGCAGSEEGMTEGDPMQKSTDSLEAEIATMQSKMSRLEQDNRNLTAQVADLETRLAEASKPSPAPAPRPMGDAMSEYERGLSLHRERNYQEAIAVFMGLLNTEPPENLESNCHYWTGECYYAMREYNEGLPHFEKVLEYPRTTKRDDAQLMIANCYKRLGDKARAKQEYQTLVDKYPASQYVQRAKGELAKLP